MAAILAFGSAAVFALGTVLQQRVAEASPEAQQARCWRSGSASPAIGFRR